MAREYGKNLFSTWTDDDFTSQPIFDKLLYQVLLGQPPTLLNHAGVQPLSLRRWRKAMRDGDAMPTEDAMMAALGRMEVRRFVYTDEDTCEVLVRSLIRRDGVAKQPTVLLSALRSAALVESPKLAAVLLDELTNRVELPTITGDSDYSERLRKSLAATFEAALTHLRTLSETYPGPSRGGSTRPAEIANEGGGSSGGSTGGSSGPPVEVVVEVEVVKSPLGITQVESLKTVEISKTVATVDAPKGAATRGAYIAPDFTPNDSTRQWAVDRYSHLDLRHELEAFRDYWLGESGQRARKRDWNAAFRKWLSNNSPNAAPMRNGSRGPTGTQLAYDNLDRLAAKYAAETQPAEIVGELL